MGTDKAASARPIERKNEVLESINRIFGEALSTKNEEQLACACLAVAEDVTGARTSFMSEVDVRSGEFVRRTISDRAREAHAASRPPPGSDALPGIAPDAVTRVLRGGESVIVNGPAGADRPTPRAFLGVPLKQDGRTVGMIGLIDRDGGFRAEDRAAAEALAPAILHALRSKHAEEALRASERRLQVLVEGVPQMVWRAVNGGHWTWASPQWTEYTAQKEVDSHGLGWLDPVHPEDREGVQKVWADAIQRGEFHADYRVRHASEGRYRWFQTRATPVRDDRGRVIEWLGTSTDVDDLRRLQERQQTLVAELQHRVRNILTVVRSVFSRTADMSNDVEQVADHFRGRLDSLARTQVIVTQSASGRVDLENLIREELLSVGASDSPALTIEGPEVALPPKAAESIGLAIHELTTNAVKYGALRTPGARLHVSWTTNMDYGGVRRLNLIWSEQGVPAISVRPARQGFGSELITEALPYRLGAETSLQFRGGGIRCTISVPLPEDMAAPDWRQG